MIHIFRYESTIASLFQSSLAENEENSKRDICLQGLFLHGSYGVKKKNYHKLSESPFFQKLNLH